MMSISHFVLIQFLVVSLAFAAPPTKFPTLQPTEYPSGKLFFSTTRSTAEPSIFIMHNMSLYTSYIMIYHAT